MISFIDSIQVNIISQNTTHYAVYVTDKTKVSPLNYNCRAFVETKQGKGPMQH